MNMSTLTLTLSLIFISNSVHAMTVTAGIDDSFGGGADLASPSPALAASLGVPLIDFDIAGQNTSVAHTFTDLPSILVAGTLRFRVRGTANGANTDGIALSFVTDPADTYVDEIAYRRTFGTFGGGGTVFSDPDSGLITPGSEWAIGSNALVELDLAALPLDAGGTFNILPLIEAAGFIDVLLGDDSMVDFIELNLQPVPIPPSAALFLSALVTLRLFKRRP